MRLQLVAAVTAYVVSLTSLWGSDVTGPTLAAAVLALAGWRFARAQGRARHDRRTSLEAAAAFTFAVGTGAAVRASVPSGDSVEPMLLLYEVTIIWIAVFLAARLRRPEPAVVADLVVELGERRSGELRSALATALGDPTLEVGFWTALGRYVDGAGSTLPLPLSGGDRVATFVERGDEPFAVLVHDAAVLDNPALVEAVATATRLAATNVALSAELRARLTELAASRRRLVVAADEARRRLATRLRSGVDQSVADLRSLVTEAAQECDGTAIGDHVRRAADHLDHAASDLHQLARGLHPRELDAGLVIAVTALAECCPVPVQLALDGVSDAKGEIVVAAYYVCAEALTNVAKHAGATRARIEAGQHAGRVLVTVTDDGCGGADPRSGSGLRGLADRVEALGGTLTVTSPPVGGTQLVADLPLGQP